MSILNIDKILTELRNYYRDGTNSLLFRNSPVFKSLGKTTISDNKYCYSVLYGDGGSASGNYDDAKDKALKNNKFTDITVPCKELYGSYFVDSTSIKDQTETEVIHGAELFIATESLRKLIATSFYGMGYGEFFKVKKEIATKSGIMNNVQLSEESIMSIHVGTTFQGTIESGFPGNRLGKSINVITNISENVITFSATENEVYPENSYLCISGCRDTDGTPLLPQGLSAWVPSIYERKDEKWDRYIENDFNGLKRSKDIKRLAGEFIIQAENEKISDCIKRLYRLVYRSGSKPNVIAINDRVYAALLKELTPGYYKKETSQKESQNTSIDLDFASQYLDYIIEDPYCPSDLIYIFDNDKIEFVFFNQKRKMFFRRIKMIRVYILVPYYVLKE
ncbi:hypothetical protein [Leadbettera azotonutricia]|uniref:Uncharacterized protein n=1 Tax=Leadbettera azotonutricia (strain ATCC BAA-888 / DSM 13862 / ZAS-9) TaxID=545695 RepID=F5YEG8_LEAAZ|nr:hypothetical protein [Leadbettera azotonutricia]AEF82081.1 hypothetical protein TREAZ_2601 [Leadbettera azotonutricia ZAS-9]